MTKFQHYLLYFLIQVLKRGGIGIGYAKIQINRRRKKILDVCTFRDNKLAFYAKMFTFFAGGDWYFQRFGEEKFCLGIGIYRF